MKHLLLSIILICSSLVTQAEVRQATDGQWYGNICFASNGWAYVPFAPVGTLCIIPGNTVYGVIINR